MALMKSALVTGAGSGIGAALATELARRGYGVTAADISAESAEGVANDIRRTGGNARAVCCDVRDDSAQHAMFDAHLECYGRLDVVCLNAGVLEKGWIFAPNEEPWRETMEINLTAQVVGARLAVLAMQKSGSKGLQAESSELTTLNGGVVMFTSSASGIFPMPEAPVYSAAKAGVVSFARSIAPGLAQKGICVYTLCPNFVDTAMTRGASKTIEARYGRGPTAKKAKAALFGAAFRDQQMLPMAHVVKAAMYLLEGSAEPGAVLLLPPNRRAYEFHFHKQSLRRVDIEPAPLQHAEKPLKPRLVKPAALRLWATSSRPQTRRKVQVHKLSADFRCATRVAEEPIPQPRSGQVLVRRMYAGVNASDVNFTAGRYFGSTEKSAERLPFDAGFEAVGVVAGVGPGVNGLKVGDAVAEMSFGAYSEWAVVEQKFAIPVPTCSPEIVALLTSGLTASIGLEAVGQMGSGETILVTAAAGGTGQFVTQLAKAAGNHVVATCGSRDKAELLKRLGADRVINYREEDVKEVLRREYKQGLDLVWESVGGEMFDICVKSLATNGRLIVIGMMSQYGAGWKPSVNKGLLELLLWKSLSVRGFFLLHFARLFKPQLQKLARQWMEGSVQVSIDPTTFVGVDRVADAVEHLQAGQSLGKVVVQLSSHLPQEDAVSKL